MYVIMDIEWLERKGHINYYTQIAALRTNDDWSASELFFSRIRPSEPFEVNWHHMAFCGGKPEDFLSAPTLSTVMTNLQSWLRNDDVLCFWDKEPMQEFRKAFSIAFKQQVPFPTIVLRNYMPKYIAAKGTQKQKPVRILSACGKDYLQPVHCSENDALNIRSVLELLEFPQSELKSPPTKFTPAAEKDHPSDTRTSYFMDLQSNTVHSADCNEIPGDAARIVDPGPKFFLRDKYLFCSCMDQARKDAKRARNLKIINRDKFNFLYIDSSPVFHRKGCRLLLSCNCEIKGTVYYQSCEKTGRRPCKVCRPENDIPKPEKVKSAYVPPPNKKSPPERKQLPSYEQGSLERFIQARDERFSVNLDKLSSDEEKHDFLTLTQSRYGFFAAVGYSKFRLRNCPSLEGLSMIKGFERYNDAISAGYSPCKKCRPSDKHNILCSIPIDSKTRSDETISDISNLCKQYGYSVLDEEDKVIIRTPAGKWAIIKNTMPYRLHHINLINSPDNESDFHRQARLFLSMTDIVKYIHHHDSNLIKQAKSTRFK